MNVCLIRPSKLVASGAPLTGATWPLGMAYIAGSLRKAGHHVTIIDGFAEAPKQVNDIEIPFNSTQAPKGSKLSTQGLTPEETLNRIPPNTQVVGFSCMFSNNWLADRQLINYLGAHLPGVTFIAGGESITGLADTCLEQAAPLKVCVLGEGEETAIALVDALEKNMPLSEVNGIAYKEEGKVYRTAHRNRLKNLEEIAPPAWDIFPVDSYEVYHFNGKERKSLPLMATRGCPYSCTFCTSPDMWGTRYYMRRPEHVVAEMEYLMKRFGVSHFDFYDLTAIIKKEWIIEFTNLIIDRKLDIVWRIPAGTRSEAIDGEVARNLHQSGCWSITYAPESGSVRMLKLIKKKVVIPNMLRSMRLSAGERMRIQINMILALPDEKHLDVWRSLWFLIRCSWVGVNDMGLFVFRAYPGSALFDRMVQEGKVQLKNDDFFIESIFIIENMWKNDFYNLNVGKRWYRFYYTFLVISFFTSNFLFRPNRIYRSARNIITSRHEHGFETKLVFFLKNLFSFYKSKSPSLEMN